MFLLTRITTIMYDFLPVFIFNFFNLAFLVIGSHIAFNSMDASLYYDLFQYISSKKYSDFFV